MATRRKAKKAMSAERFFTVVGPRLFSAMQGQLSEMGGRYAIVVDGEGGGAWTLDYAAGRIEDGKGDADLTLTLTADQWASLARPKTELRSLVSKGEVPAEGDTDKVENLSLLIAFLGAG